MARSSKRLAHHAAEHRGDAAGLARDAGLGQVAGEQPVLRGHPGIGVAHAAAAERRRRAGGEAEAGGHLQHARGRRRVVVPQPRDRGGGAERAPGAVRMRGRAEARRHADPRARLVAGDGRVEQGRAVRVPRLGLGERGGDRVDARMAAGGIVALVEFERRAGEAVEEGGNRRRGAEAGAGQPARSAGGVAPGRSRPPPRPPARRRSRRACPPAPARRGRAPRPARKRRRCRRGARRGSRSGTSVRLRRIGLQPRRRSGGKRAAAG